MCDAEPGHPPAAAWPAAWARRVASAAAAPRRAPCRGRSRAAHSALAGRRARRGPTPGRGRAASPAVSSGARGGPSRGGRPCQRRTSRLREGGGGWVALRASASEDGGSEGGWHSAQAREGGMAGWVALSVGGSWVSAQGLWALRARASGEGGRRPARGPQGLWGWTQRENVRPGGCAPITWMSPSSHRR
eukprot:2114020-Prymnesium_polylepis.1